ncbi:MAG: zf-HC2 domain-containing protein [Tumebacillaceae bacterium]
MTCQHSSQIEAYLDGELSREARKEFAKHLDHCTSCRTLLAEHKRLAQWAEEVILESLPDVSDDRLDNFDVDAAWSRFQTNLQQKSAPAQMVQADVTHPKIPTRRWSFMAKTYQKWLVGTAASVVVLSSLTLPQVQAAGSSLLSMFRAEKFETIRITEQDVQEVQSWLSSGSAGERSLNGLGTITRRGTASHSQHFEDLGLAKAEGYEPAPNPTGFTAKSLSMQPEMTMEFRLQTAKANSLLKSLGSDVRFDEALNDKPFAITFPRMTQTQYVSAENAGMELAYTVLKTPHMEAPEGVDLNQLRTTILQLPFLPQNVSAQLARIEDWQNTVPVPYVEGSNMMEKTTVNGVEGIFVGTSQGNSEGTTDGVILIWQKDGKLHRLEQLRGNMSATELKPLLLELAKTYN